MFSLNEDNRMVMARHPSDMRKHPNCAVFAVWEASFAVCNDSSVICVY